MPSTRFFFTIATLLSAAPAITVAADDEESKLVVNVYEGPTECSEEDTIKAQDFISISMSGKIDESSKFGVVGQSVQDAEDFNFEIGKDMTIDCWEKGLMGLCKGAKATILCSSDLVDIKEDDRDETHPLGSTVLFDVTIKSLNEAPSMGGDGDGAPPMIDYFGLMDTDKDEFLTIDEMFAFLDLYDEDGDGKLSEEEYRNGPEPPTFEFEYTGGDIDDEEDPVIAAK